MKVKKYDTPVWKSRVPLLTDYLSDAARAVGEQLSQVRLWPSLGVVDMSELPNLAIPYSREQSGRYA